jgi:hypothetical protein
MKIGMQPEVDAERPGCELTDVADLPTQIIRGQIQARKNAQAPGAGHRSDELRSGDPSHARLNDWILDLQRPA